VRVSSDLLGRVGFSFYGHKEVREIVKGIFENFVAAIESVGISGDGEKRDGQEKAL
jgi:hypothetical protein